MSGERDRIGLRALRPGANLKNDVLTLLEDLVAAQVNGGIVYENVLPPPSTVMNP